jgi:hypothetical protein
MGKLGYIVFLLPYGTSLNYWSFKQVAHYIWQLLLGRNVFALEQADPKCLIVAQTLNLLRTTVKAIIFNSSTLDL